MYTLSLLLCAVLSVPAPSYSIICTNPEVAGSPLTMEEATISKAVRPRVLGAADFGWKTKRSDCPLTSREGSLYLHDTVLVAQGGEGIVYGEPVSRHEFGTDSGIFPGPSGLVAFYRKDESAVYRFPLLDISDGGAAMTRYPMIGQDSERISLGICDTRTGSVLYGPQTDGYITNVCWSPSGKLFVQLLDRPQHNCSLVEVDTSTGEFGPAILTEHSEEWVEPLDPIRFFGDYDRVFVYATDCRDGYRNFYLCDRFGSCRRIVQTDADLEFVTVEGDYLYYTSAEVSPLENHLFRVRIAGRGSVRGSYIGKPERLTQERGWHAISCVPGHGLIDNFSSFEGTCFARTISTGPSVSYGKKVPTSPRADYSRGAVELGKVSSADGSTDNYYRLTYPVGYEEGRQYPLLVYVYGGPHSQMVAESYLGRTRYWEQLMAAKGYLVYTQDNRGTMRRGSAYEKAINRHCGRLETLDQLAGIDVLISRGLVDTSRVAVHGWSYGGFMTLTMATQRPSLFKAAVAGGPVTDWRFYEVMYGERYMDTPSANPEGFAESSLMERAGLLKARTLICQGAMDDTVLYLNCYSFIQKCIDLGIQLDFFTFPCAAHNMLGSERVYLYDKITSFIDANMQNPNNQQL